MSLAQMFRKTCSECHSARLVWMRSQDLVALVPQHKAAVVLQFGPGCEAWRCEDCGGFGVFG